MFCSLYHVTSQLPSVQHSGASQCFISHTTVILLPQVAKTRESLKYYVLSGRRPHDRAGIWNIEGPKEYSPQLQKGQRLCFMLRANPVVFSSAAGKKRYDVVMHAKKNTGYSALPFSQKPPLQKLVQESCAKWLGKRAASNGFSFEAKDVIAEGYRQHKSLQRAKGKSFICYSSVDFQGALTVSDPEKFKHILMRGIGKSKAFGCGLMLVKRA